MAVNEQAVDAAAEAIYNALAVTGWPQWGDTEPLAKYHWREIALDALNTAAKVERGGA